jgi:hypothetical protein
MLENIDFLGAGEFTIRDEVVSAAAKEITRKKNTAEFPREISRFVKGLKRNISNKAAEYRMRTASQIIKSGDATGCTDEAIVYAALARQLGIPARYVETFYTDWLNFNPSEELVEAAAKFASSSRKDIQYAKEGYDTGLLDKSEAENHVYEAWLRTGNDSTITPQELSRLLNGDNIEGHCFVDINVCGWMSVDPKKGFVKRVRDHGEEFYFKDLRESFVVGKGLDFSAVYILKNGVYSQEPERLVDVKKSAEIARQP